MKTFWKKFKQAEGFTQPQFLKNLKNGAGFTLVEMLLATFIFALMTMAIAGIYVGFSKLQARAKVSQELLNDTQFVLESMVRQIRNTEIYDYDPSGSGACVSILGNGYDNCLLLVREDGQLLAFVAKSLKLSFITPPCTVDDISTCADWVDDTDESAITVMIADDINKIRLDTNGFVVKIEPGDNPYDGDPNQQPRVTIMLRTKYVGLVSTNLPNYKLQTTVSSRIYKR